MAIPRTSRGKRELHVTHFNIRQSIVLLVLRLALLEIVGLVLILFLRLPMELLSEDMSLKTIYLSLEYRLFIAIIVIKAFTSIFLILQWLNEYYELWPDRMIHRRGIIFRVSQEYKFEHVTVIGLRQTLLGEICNFGTIYFFEKDMKVYIYFQSIHNPKRYMDILEELNPGAEIEREQLRQHFIENIDTSA